MKIFKKINEMSVASAVIIAGILISLAIFFTVYFFFGGYNNRTKLFLTNPPTQQRNFPANFNPQQQAQQIQLQQMQQQQAQQGAQPALVPAGSTINTQAPVVNTVKPAPVTAPAPKTIKK